MIIKSSREMNVSAFQEPVTPPVQKTAESTSTGYKSEKSQPQPKIVKPEVKRPKVEIKPEVKAESQVEIKKEEIVEVPKKRSLLEEVLEEQAILED